MTKFHIAEIPGPMYRGSVSDVQGNILDHTRAYYNRKNARAAAIALKREIDNQMMHEAEKREKAE